ncbi:GTP 3',8-cyclase MoaA [Helicobacter anatolicus]|uniref:GTP 3',8-cyclase MoaA n=1 Tax=Helicobacter anatolicus TaxID=2905874 RepID=UPI001E3B9BBB|nr:GTP 3',8-cyclase MoaA [Helicobacter anatolicus]MCE3039250.1 GTP 3',8-cyclase MoaA [Helicobacter anatolicus]
MLQDTFGRTIDYIRVSVTKQCNFRCQYCMPNTPFDAFDKDEYIPLDNVLEFLKVGIDQGIKKIRITGGEPLLRKDLPEFIAKLREYSKDVQLVLTTNGFLLQKSAEILRKAGLDRINISLDSLKREKIMQISKKDGLNNVLLGIEEALRHGFGIKINSVILKGVNDDEILDLMEYAKNKNISIRFIEYMENIHASDAILGVREKDILEKIATKFKFKILDEQIIGPAKLYQCDDGYIFGIIAPHNDDFCQTCNRIRLTAEGVICPCLYYQDSVDAKPALMSKDPKEIKKVLEQAVFNKPEKNQWDESMPKDKISARAFYHTGG